MIAIAHNVIKVEIRTNQLIGINRFLTFLSTFHLSDSVNLGLWSLGYLELSFRNPLNFYSPVKTRTG